MKSVLPLMKTSQFIFTKKAIQTKAGHPCFYVQDEKGTYWPVAYIRPSRCVSSKLFEQLVDSLAANLTTATPRQP